MNVEVFTASNDLPALPGLTFRQFVDDADYMRIASLRAAANAVDGVESADDPQQLKHFFEHLDGFNLHRDLLFADVGNETIGYGRLYIYTEKATSQRVFSVYGLTHPAWRGKGLGRAILQRFEQQARAIMAEKPLDTPSCIESFITCSRGGAVELFTQAGYQPVRYFHLMKRPDLESIPELALPDGIETRPALPEQYRQIWDAACEAFSEHWGYYDITEEAYQGYLTSPEFQPELWQVAWEGNEVVGMVRSYINHKENDRYGFLRGWTEDICVRKPWRGKGVARALIARSLQTLKDHGMQHATLGVDVDNPTGALRLYESMGYQTYTEEVAFRKLLG